MILEIRRYEIEPGRRDEFVAFFDEEVLPEMRKVGMQIIGQFVSVEDPNVFFYLRAFEDEAQRESQTAAFYDSPAWTGDLRDKALDMETGYHVDVVEPTLSSAIG
jgi:hypothetical protein